MQDSLSMELHADKVRCPVFLLNCVDDPTVDWHNAQMMSDSLKDKYVIYLQSPVGGHGFGVSEKKMAKYNSTYLLVWPDKFLIWMKVMEEGYLKMDREKLHKRIMEQFNEIEMNHNN